tara:strand:+ start:1369 stop:1917 length:549 start_codon:yes stop_codon:yes gene_type:complete
MKKILFFLIIIFHSNALANNKEKIIENFSNIKNLNFKFEQNINGDIENGDCTIQYPKKINCEYYTLNKKKLVSNGKSLVIKTNSGSYYLYPIEKTPLNLILDKDFLISKIKTSQERKIDDMYLNYTFVENSNEIKVFFDLENHNLIGWQILDIYQNLSMTYLYSISKNKKLEPDFFKLPKPN